MGLKASNKLETNRYELEIEVSAEDFAKAVDVAYNKQKGKITIPGFRKGKAPKSFIERYYGEQVFYEDAINELYPDALENASKEAGLELVDDHIDFDWIKADFNGFQESFFGIFKIVLFSDELKCFAV